MEYQTKNRYRIKMVVKMEREYKFVDEIKRIVGPLSKKERTQNQWDKLK